MRPAWPHWSTPGRHRWVNRKWLQSVKVFLACSIKQIQLIRFIVDAQLGVEVVNYCWVVFFGKVACYVWELLNNSEENCTILRNGILIKNDNIYEKFDHKTFKFVSKKLMDIVGVDNFYLEPSSFKK
jgi:hypothetical protein